MKLLQTLAIVGVTTLMLTSCFGKTDSGIKSDSQDGKSESVNGMPSEALLKKINVQAEEQQRVSKLDTLTSDNFKTQVESKDGKNVLRDRRLFVNYMVSKGVRSSKDLISRLGEVQSFAKKEGVDLNESDIMTIIASTDVRVESWDLCSEFKDARKNLDSKNEFYSYILKFCGTDIATGAK